MFASSSTSLARRRGIVLVVVLGMLGLMALIGVTFATFAGQSLIASRNFTQGVARPQPEALMDYALAQLINDTNNPISAIRGHSLLRDMYGNDSVFRGANPTANPAAQTQGVLKRIFSTQAGGYVPLQFTTNQPIRMTNSTNGGSTAFYGQYQYSTNIPTSGQYYGFDFTRWLVRIAINGVPQTLEILEDDTVSGNFHLFTLAANLLTPTTDPTTLGGGNINSSDWASFIYADPNLGATVNNDAISKVTNLSPLGYTSLGKEVYMNLNNNTLTPATFTLDGRYMRAFNGAGMTATATRNTDVYPYNYAAYGNFRLNGLDPDTSTGMDEDYDACDLENWFLAIQSADGQVVVPSFHRPGILMAGDWTSGGLAAAKILRPRLNDNSPLFPPDPSSPDPITGKLTYDIDNDGDGVTDSVWLDLGYSVQRDPGGKLYKPLFAFMVLGLNGRLPLNTVGNLQARATGDQSNTLAISGTNTGGLTYPNGNVGGPSSLNGTAAVGPNPATPGMASATTQVPYPGPLNGIAGTGGSPDATYFQSSFSSQAYLDAPLWDHTSHLGYSTNEINPKFALQNAPANLYSNTLALANLHYSQYDNVGMSVSLTQLRNILAGTVPASSTNGDLNTVYVNGSTYVLPNNVADSGDNVQNSGGTPVVLRTATPVPGRWGEAAGVPIQMIGSTSTSPLNPALYSGGSPNLPIYYPMYWYNNPVRAGRSAYIHGTNDAMDDDFDALDPLLPNLLENANNTFTLEASITNGNSDAYHIPLSPLSTQTQYTGTTMFTRSFPEAVDLFDPAGQMAVASERMRRFTTPTDPSGAGRAVDWLNRPNNEHDYGKGYDKFGRASYFRYFRPAGMPQEVRYPYPAVVTSTTGTTTTYTYPYPYATNSGLGQQFLMPVLLPAGQSSNPTPNSKSDIHTNRLHGFQSALTPTVNTMTSTQTVAPMATMPYDWDMYGNPNSATPMPGTPSTPGGYGAAYTYNSTNMMYTASSSVNLLAPTINPTVTVNPGTLLLSEANSSWGPNLNPNGVPAAYLISLYGQASPLSGLTQPTVVNGYIGSVYQTPGGGSTYITSGSLNLDEADEMNLYNPSLYDQPYGPSDLEWLYRLQDVDGSTLASRLSQLAPVSFLNPADGLTRRRLFSTDSWELNRFVWANDNPNGSFAYNSRFLPNASPSLEILNQVVSTSNTSFVPDSRFANYIATEFLPNPTFPPELVHNGNTTTIHNNIGAIIQNASQIGNNATGLPLALTPHGTSSLQVFGNATATATGSNLVIQPYGSPSTIQVQTPSIAHGDRKINLNFPLPISNEPAEPIRQKWCRETYQMLKAILPPASIDTPEELAALSQFVVNIVDFRDTDCTMTRFVNTDLEVTDALTKSLNNTLGSTLQVNSTIDPIWTVSPSGVRFATTPIPIGNFPYDPSLYSPDPVPDPNNAGNYIPSSPYLVQHGMEFNPIALNEAIAYQAQYGTSPNALMPYQAMFLELVNTLTEELNNTGASNASAISLVGWDIVIAPDAVGFGRPDPITGNINPVAAPIYVPDPMSMTPTAAPDPMKRVGSGSSDMNTKNMQTAIQQFSIPAGSPAVTGITSGGTPDYYIVGDYRSLAATPTRLPSATVEGTTANGGNPVAQDSQINLRFPLMTFQFPTPPAKSASYFWAYLRRPANPFDIATPTQVRPNKEMVVVDSIRLPVIDATNSTLGGGAMPVPTVSPNVVYSSERFQPYRGGHLVRTTTAPNTTTWTLPTTGSLGAMTTTICPPSPPHAYGYSEQMGPPPTGNGYGVYATTTTPPGGGASTTTYRPTTKVIKQSINDSNTIRGGANNSETWCHLPFNDRDFTSVAELLLVPGCPPGLFTKQFVEEPYPGNIFSNSPTYPTPGNTATGTDDSDFQMGGQLVATGGTASIISPSDAPATNNPSLAGRQNFNTVTANLPATPTFPYLPDQFYYSGASVAPPVQNGNNLDPMYLTMTTEIGGWTGAGWHKMLEFFEVPSSANGAIGTADGGNNYDWARSDLKPGLLNLNLIIDEEVFAGLIDDARLNEALASSTSIIPAVVTQIDGNGYPVYNGNTNSPYYGLVYGAQPIFPPTSTSTNPFLLYGASGTLPSASAVSLPAGRGYAVRDSNVLDYSAGVGTAFNSNQQQLHGMKAAFADFLKLRHGGSGYLFAFGSGPTGSGDYPLPLAAPNSASQASAVNPNGGLLPLYYPPGSTLVSTAGSPYLTMPLQGTTYPVAAERPYRSLSYPDINYTIMRPASLPPSYNSNFKTIMGPGNYSPYGTNNLPTVSVTTVPPVPISGTALPSGNNVVNGLDSLLSYGPVTGFPYVSLLPTLAPMNQGNPRNTVNGNTNPPYQYVYDPGLKNPFLPFQFANVNAMTPLTSGTPATAAGQLQVAPPYPTPTYPSTATPAPLTPAPFPPTIPPTPALRLFQVPDHRGGGTYSSNASMYGQINSTAQANITNAWFTNNTNPADQDLSIEFTVNQPTTPLQLSSGLGLLYQSSTAPTFPANFYPPRATTPTAYPLAPFPPVPQSQSLSQPHLVPGSKSFFLPDNLTPTWPTAAAVTAATTNGVGTATVPASPALNHLGSGAAYSTTATTNDYRQHPLYRTEWLQKIMNLTTVRTHQFAVWITIGFFEVTRQGTPELGIPDVLGQELGLTAGRNVRYRSFFVLDRTNATGFNPYYPGNFRDCVTYRRRIE